MSRQLIESIIAGDMIEANDMVEATLAQIRERKLYEMKRMFAAKMDEVFGGLSPEEIALRKKAGYRKAADVLGDPWDKRKKKIPLPDKNKPSLPDMKKEKRIGEEALDEAGLGAGARLAHDPSWTPELRSGFRAALSKRREARRQQSSTDYQRPGLIKRNINTLKGRDPGYVDKRTPEEKLMKKGGRVGKAIRGTAKVTGKVIGSVASDLSSIGTSNLE